MKEKTVLNALIQTALRQLRLLGMLGSPEVRLKDKATKDADKPKEPTKDDQDKNTGS